MQWAAQSRRDGYQPGHLPKGAVFDQPERGELAEAHGTQVGAKEGGFPDLRDTGWQLQLAECRATLTEPIAKPRDCRLRIEDERPEA